MNKARKDQRKEKQDKSIQCLEELEIGDSVIIADKAAFRMPLSGMLSNVGTIRAKHSNGKYYVTFSWAAAEFSRKDLSLFCRRIKNDNI